MRLEQDLNVQLKSATFDRSSKEARNCTSEQAGGRLTLNNPRTTRRVRPIEGIASVESRYSLVGSLVAI